MKIELLYFDGCPTWKEARKVLEEVLAEEGIEAQVEMVKVETDEDVQRHRFVGSPSIRIDGLDLEPMAREWTDYRMACRTYLTEGGLRGWPTGDMIKKAILRRGK